MTDSHDSEKGRDEAYKKAFDEHMKSGLREYQADRMLFDAGERFARQSMIREMDGWDWGEVLIRYRSSFAPGSLAMKETVLAKLKEGV